MRRAALAAALPIAFALALASCDDQVKYVSWFSSMAQQPSVGTYQEPGRPPVEGTMPAGGWVEYTILEADSLLENPLTMTSDNLIRGDSLYQSFCLPCHGDVGQGDGPVVGPGRLPPTPIMNLTSDRARELTDGYIWGLIGQGRGLMPSYARILPDDRWYIILRVRELQGETEPAQ